MTLASSDTVETNLTLAFMGALILWGIIKLKWPAITFNSDAAWTVEGPAKPSRSYLRLQRLSGVGFIVGGGTGIYFILFK